MQTVIRVLNRLNDRLPRRQRLVEVRNLHAHPQTQTGTRQPIAQFAGQRQAQRDQRHLLARARLQLDQHLC